MDGRGMDRRWTWDVGLLSVCAGSRQLGAPLQVLGPPHLVSRTCQRRSVWAYFTYGNERTNAGPSSTIQVQRRQPDCHQHDLAADLFAVVHLSISHQVGLLHSCGHDISVAQNLAVVPPRPRGAHAKETLGNTTPLESQCGGLTYAEKTHGFFSHSL